MMEKQKATGHPNLGVSPDANYAIRFRVKNVLLGKNKLVYILTIH